MMEPWMVLAVAAVAFYAGLRAGIRMKGAIRTTSHLTALLADDAVLFEVVAAVHHCHQRSVAKDRCLGCDNPWPCLAIQAVRTACQVAGSKERPVP